MGSPSDSGPDTSDRRKHVAMWSGAHTSKTNVLIALSDAVRTSRTFAKVRPPGLGERTTAKD